MLATSRAELSARTRLTTMGSTVGDVGALEVLRYLVVDARGGFPVCLGFRSTRLETPELLCQPVDFSLLVP
jgi:hypothetical protein